MTVPTLLLSVALAFVSGPGIVKRVPASLPRMGAPVDQSSNPSRAERLTQLQKDPTGWGKLSPRLKGQVQALADKKEYAARLDLIIELSSDWTTATGHSLRRRGLSPRSHVGNIVIGHLLAYRLGELAGWKAVRSIDIPVEEKHLQKTKP